MPVFFLGVLAGASQFVAKVRTNSASEILTPIQKFDPFVHTSTVILSMLSALSAASAPSPPCCQNVAIDATEEVEHANVGNHNSPLHAFDRLSIGDALHMQRVRRYR